MRDEEVLAEQAAEYAHFAVGGDMAGLADAVMRAAYRNGTMTGPGIAGTAWLRALPDEHRRELARIWAHRLAALPDDRQHEDLRFELLIVASSVVRGLDPDLLADERRSRLRVLGGEYVYPVQHRLWELAEAEVAAGRPMDRALAAVFRRTVLVHYRCAGIKRLLEGYKGPALNPGEEWADRATADAAAYGEPWERLLAHAASATGARPSARWERVGRALLADAGPESVRRHVHTWWDLLGRPRTVPFAQDHYRWRDVNERFDPHNANALRGLAWLLSFLPARADTAAALAALVDVSLVHVEGTGSRNPKVANAGVTALSRVGDDAARTELRALAGRVAFKATLTHIDNALAIPS